MLAMQGTAYIQSALAAPVGYGSGELPNWVFFHAVAAHLTAIQSALKMLSGRIGILHQHIQSMQDGNDRPPSVSPLSGKATAGAATETACPFGCYEILLMTICSHLTVICSWSEL